MLRAKEYPEEKEKISKEVESLYLTFYNPANSEVELVKGGSEIELTLDNAQDYIDRVVQSTFDTSVKAQVKALWNGLMTYTPP